MLTEFVMTVLSVLTIIAYVFLLISLAIFLTRKKVLKNLYNLASRNNLLFAFIIALIATLGSLFFSEIAHFTPCNLCWFQRIFMYPLSIILLIAFLKKDQSVKKYVLPLSLIGAIIAAYHYTIQVLSISTICSADGPDCAANYIFTFKYISIPLMALAGFLMIIVFLTLYGKRK